MAEKTWEELLVWKLEGLRFDEHGGVDLSDLEAFLHLRNLLVSITKSAWKRQNGKKQIPQGAERDVDIRIRGFEDGCVESTVWLGIPPPPIGTQISHLQVDDRTSFFRAFHSAAATVESLIVAVRDSLPLPDDVPREAIPEVEKMTRRLRKGEQVTVRASRRALAVSPENGAATPTPGSPTATETATEGTPTRPSATIDDSVREKILALREQVEKELAAERQRTVATIVMGEVTMASIDGRATLLLDSGDEIDVLFNPKDELRVTRALHERASVRLRMRGTAEVDVKGKIRRFQAMKVGIVEALDPKAHSEELFARLSVEDPPELVRLLTSGTVRPTMLTHAAEIAGANLPTELVERPLIELLSHEAPIVREGVIYGLAYHMTDAAKAAIRNVAEKDDNEVIRGIAAKALGAR